MRCNVHHLGVVLALAVSWGLLNSLPSSAAENKGKAEDAAARSEAKAEKRTDRVILDSQYYLGGNLGIGLLSSGGGGHPGFGAVAGIHLSDEFSGGFFFSRVPRGSFTAAETNANAIGGAINYYGLEGQYHLPKVPGLQLGLKFALGANSVDNGITTTSSTDFYFGPKIAYDYAISNALTLGAEGSVLFGGSDNSRSTALLLAALKFWIA